MIEVVLAILFAQEVPEEPTWTNGIHELVLNNCMPCHDVGGAGPFHLLTYEDVAGRATFILELTRTNVMPPWMPDDSGLNILHKREISEKEIESIKLWIDSGKQIGKGFEIAVCGGSIEIPDASGQTNPDTPWIIPAESETRWHKGIRDKQTFVLPIHNIAPMKVTSFEFKTTAPRAVQMVAFVFDHQGRGRVLESWDDEPGYELMGDIGWVPSGTHGKIGPGSGVIQLPNGFHWEIPANVDLIAETHFRPRGKEEELSCTVLVHSNPAESSRPIQEVVTMIRRIVIEPEDEEYTVSERIELPVAVDLVGITPRAGAECVSMKIQSSNENGSLQTLLSIPDWDAHYGETVMYESTFRIEAGAALHSTWNYNNSDSNPRNPFVPSQLIDLARKTGVASFILHVAPVHIEDTEELVDWNLSMLRKRQRAMPIAN